MNDDRSNTQPSPLDGSRVQRVPVAESARRNEAYERPLWQQLEKVLGSDYEVLGELGRGGFAVVYSVRDRKKRSHFAVKVMHPDLMTSPQLMKRFRREIRYVARLDHPNILSLRFAGEQDDLAYFAMPRVDGRTLSDHLERYGRLQLPEVAAVLGDVAAALEYAHRHGVIHRDIKPSNVMLARTGRALVADFGIAKSLSHTGTSLSTSGQIIGTLQYMSPEQAEGTKDLDHRSDIYSWAVLGFEMLVGHAPFVGPPTAVINRLLHERAPDVRTFRPDTPRRLAKALRKCMETNRDKRWPGIREAATAAGLARS